MKHLILIILAASSFASSAASCVNGKATVYMGTGAEHTNLQEAYNSLDRSKPQCDVEIIVKPGTYKDDSLMWPYLQQDNPKALLSSNYLGENFRITIRGESSSNRPIFNGSGVKRPYFLRFAMGKGKPTNIVIKNIVIQNYANGIAILGGKACRDHRFCESDESLWFTETEATYNGNNIIENVDFINIGNKHNKIGGIGMAAIALQNSRNNEIRNNKFLNLENINGYQEHIHAVYISHGSKDNNIRYNNLRKITGAPFQTRNYSNYNYFGSNTLDYTGSDGKYGSFQISDSYVHKGGNTPMRKVDTKWVCELGECETFPVFMRECPSNTNYFYNNEWGKLYSGKVKMLVWGHHSIYDNNDVCGKLGGKRYHTGGNVQIYN